MTTLKFSWPFLIFSWILFGIYDVDGNCGFPAVPDNAQTHGSSWYSSGYQLFEEGSQMNFSCQPDFSDVQQTMRTKFCLNGTWTGDDIECYKTVDPDLYSAVVNSSKVYEGKDPAVRSEFHSKKFTGELELALPTIGGVEFVKFLLKLNEGDLLLLNTSHLPEVSIGKENCPLQNETDISDSEIQLIYSCPSKKTKGLHIIFAQPVQILGITAFLAPENKCNGRPEIPLNALAEMVGPITVRYQCRNGFALQGEETRSCDPESGLWSPDAPSCKSANEESSSHKSTNIGADDSTQISIWIGIGIGTGIGLGLGLGTGIGLGLGLLIASVKLNLNKKSRLKRLQTNEGTRTNVKLLRRSV